MDTLAQQREKMVTTQIVARGLHDPVLLRALRTVPREAFVPREMAEFAYEDTPLPIEAGQTISQPYVVALMVDALRLKPQSRVLEIGAGSGYAAAVLSRVAAEVYSVERIAELALLAQKRCEQLGYPHVHILQGDGTLGWPEHAPYDGIVVAAGGPSVPQSLLDQLAVGGNLVIPVGESQRDQELVRIHRKSPTEYEREELGAVRFVPLIGEEGWTEPAAAAPKTARTSRPATVVQLLREAAEPIHGLDGPLPEAGLDSLLDRIGDAQVVLLGEATHGTSEFYRMRARITRALIERRGFDVVAVEADWPDASSIDAYVRHLPPRPMAPRPFTRFPTWMWRNQEVHDLIEWLRAHNARTGDPERHVGFYGLDLYSLHASSNLVLRYLEEVDPEAARIARKRYGCLTPWEGDPATYGRAAISGHYRTCEKEVVAMLKDLLAKQLEYSLRDGDRFLDAVQNAHLVASAERYYRIMYYGSRESWNLRDQHMFDTLRMLLAHGGRKHRAVVWEHNSHIGDAAATEMGARGEHNVGRLCRAEYKDRAYLVGFGTDHGTVAAASEWDGKMEIKRVRPAHPESYEALCHQAEVPAFLLHLLHPARPEVREELLPARLERAIGVIYRPDTEMQSHYFQAILPRQFDSYIWFDETRAVTPLGPETHTGMPDTYPFGL